MTNQRNERGPREAGMSLIEVTVSLILMLVIGAVVFEMLIGTSRVSILAEGNNDLSTMGQQAVNTVLNDMLQAKLVLQEDSTGTPYRTLFTSRFPVGTTVYANSRMPIMDPNTSSIGADPGPNNIANRTGNSVIVVRQLQPVAISYDHDGTASTANINFMADRYQFDYYFLRQNTSASFAGLGYYLDLILAKSQIVADYFQLSAIPINGSQVVQGLRTQSPAILLAWDPGKPVSTPAFYDLASNGSMTSNANPTFTVTLTSLLPQFTGGRISGRMEYSVGLNASTPLPLQDLIPQFATASSNFPGGFEVQIVGPTRSRKVMIRLVLAYGSLGQYNSQPASVIASARGF